MGYIICTVIITIILVWMFLPKIYSWISPLNVWWQKKRLKLAKTIKIVFISLIILSVSSILFFLKNTGFLIPSLIAIGILIPIYRRQLLKMIKKFWKWLKEYYKEIIGAAIILAIIAGVVLSFWFYEALVAVMILVSLIIVMLAILAIFNDD